MGYSRDFENVVRRGEDVLVDATSIDDETMEPGTKDPATGFHVVLVKAAGGETCDVSLPVQKGFTPSWTAKFPDAAARYRDGDSVHVIGLAHVGDGPPEIWQETHKIGTRSIPSDDD